MLNKDRSTYAIQAVENALCLLESISEEPGEFGISHLSAKLGMDRSYVFRLLATFEQRGYVQHFAASGRYRAGLAAYETGGRFLHQMELLQKAKPIMESLAKETGETVYLAIPGGEDVLFLEMVDSTQQVRVIPLVGRRFSLQQFSAGKVILAFRSPAEKRSARLKTIRSEGVCVDQDELMEGVGSLSVPLFAGKGEVVGSLCVVVPSFRLNQEIRGSELIPRLQFAGQSISARLGFINEQMSKIRPHEAQSCS
jgi:DNA-binding IclR family transcriptional regulator